MDNKKGEMGIGGIVMVFITVLVGVILFQAIAQSAGSATTLDALNNFTILTPGPIGTVNGITGYKLLTTVTIRNATGLIPAASYNLSNNQVVDGVLVATITTNSGNENSTEWNVTAVSAQPVTYVSESGGRAIVALISIFFALAVLVVVMTPVLKDGMSGMMNN